MRSEHGVIGVGGVQGTSSRSAGFRLSASLSCGFFACVLLYLNSTPVVRHYAYTGVIPDESPTLLSSLLGILAALLVGALLPTPDSLPGGILIWILAVVVVIPAIITPATSPGWTVSATATALGFLVVLAAFRFIRFDIAVPRRVTTTGFLLVLSLLNVALLIVVLLVYGLAGGFSGLQEMYSVRAQTEVRAADGGPLAAYATGFVTNVCAPSLTGLGILWRRYSAAGLGAMTFVLLYLVSPSKLALILPLVSAMAALYLRWRGPEGLRASTVAGSMASLAAAMGLLFATPGNFVFAATIYRTIYVPREVALMWFDFFSNHPKGTFADAIPFVSSPYSVSLPKLMATIFGNGQGNINAHIWADGYANLGVFGVAIVSVIVGLVLAITNGVAGGCDTSAAVLMLFGPSVALTNGAVFTSLLSGGLLLTMVLIAFLPESDGAQLGGVASRTRGRSTGKGPSVRRR